MSPVLLQGARVSCSIAGRISRRNQILTQLRTRLLGRHSPINWALADQTLVSGVNFLTGILLARYLGIEEFGRYTLVWMSVLFVNSLQHAMINSPMMSIGPKQPDAETPAYYGAIIVQQIVFSCVVFLSLFAGVQWSGVLFPEWQVEGLALPLALAAVAFLFQDFLRRYFFTRSRQSVAFATDVIRYGGQIVVLFWLFAISKESVDSAQVLWVIAIMAAISALAGTFFVERVEISAKALKATATRHWHFSKWLIGSSLMQWTSGNFFLISAGTLLGPTAVGAIRAAQNLMGITHILFQGLENIVPIQASRYYHENGLDRLKTYLGQVVVNGGLATAAIALTLSVAPEFWLALVFGDSFAVYGSLVRWYGVLYILMFFGLPLRAGLRAIEHSKPIFWSYVATSIFALAVAYPLIRQFDLTGVMCGILATQVIMLSVLWVGFQMRISKKTS
jgi:O-antigen/teichoic acid export membrane protein